MRGFTSAGVMTERTPRLADAAARLRGKPGRPRNPRPDGVPRPAVTTVAVAAVPPRLLDLHATGLYLGLKDRKTRALEAAGILHRVRIPGAGQSEVRKLLFDREDLDRLITIWKDGGR